MSRPLPPLFFRGTGVKPYARRNGYGTRWLYIIPGAR